jgi:hypothetical protein
MRCKTARVSWSRSRWSSTASCASMSARNAALRVAVMGVVTWLLRLRARNSAVTKSSSRSECPWNCPYDEVTHSTQRSWT